MRKRWTIRHRVYDQFGGFGGINTHTSMAESMLKALDEANQTIAGQYDRVLHEASYSYVTDEQLVNELHEKAQDRAETIESMGAPPATAEDVIIYINDIGKEEGYPEDVIQEAIHQIEARI